MCLARAACTQSRTVTRASAARSTGSKLRPLARFSARASASNWVTRRAACSELVAICSSERATSAGTSWRSANSAWVRSPASGVFIWCAASAMKRFCSAMFCSSRASRSLNEVTSGSISGGARCASTGDRSSGRRVRMCACSAFSGASPRDSPNQTSRIASGRITNCGRITPLMMSLASALRLSSVSPTCTSTGCEPLEPPSATVV